MLGYFDNQTSISLLQSPEISEILQEYFVLLSIEETPEKGERRFSDDYIFILEEIFRDSISDTVHHSIDGVKLFRITLLEYCLKQSQYNFDIAIQLTKLYTDLNTNELFKEKLKYFEFKGVQMEALGYIAIRHLISHNDDI